MFVTKAAPTSPAYIVCVGLDPGTYTVDSATNGVLLAKASPSVDRVLEHDAIDAAGLIRSGDRAFAGDRVVKRL